MKKLTLHEEYRLIERSEDEVNGAWKGAHLLLFFLAFVFGSFCTFCFHMLMYLFEEKCVLFPKLLSLTSMRHNVIYEFIPDKSDRLPVDFLSTQWVEKSACYLPTYVPLVSGIFGLVWTTMFLMCSTGSRTLTGLQRSWRVIPPVFVFSLAMGGLCIYSSTVTHYGLQELCIKLGEITGSSTCSYTVNVATLAYERRIRGVYQATRLTIVTAWLHTTCWLLSALLALIRILLAVDFQLVRVSAELLGDFDKILENYEEQIRTFSPDQGVNIKSKSDISSQTSTEFNFQNKDYNMAESLCLLSDRPSDVLFFADEYPTQTSELSLVPDERNKLARLETYQSVSRNKLFIVRILFELVDTMELPENPIQSPLDLSTSSSLTLMSETMAIARQFGQEDITSKSTHKHETKSQTELTSLEDAQRIADEIRINLQERLNHQLIELSLAGPITASSSKKKGNIAFESTMQITAEMKQALQENLGRALKEAKSEKQELTEVMKKSNLKHKGIQTDKKKKGTKKGEHKVTISESRSTYFDNELDNSNNEDSSESLDDTASPSHKEQ